MKRKTTKKSNVMPLLAVGGLGVLAYLLLSGDDDTTTPPPATSPQSSGGSTTSTQGTGIVAGPKPNLINSLNVLPSSSGMSRQQALGIIVAAKAGRTATQFASFDTPFLVAWASGITVSYINKATTTFIYNNKRFYIATGKAI